MISRRKFIGAIGAVGAVCGCRSVLGEVPRHRSDYAGIRIGAITYSFAQMSEFPRGCTEKFILGAGLGSVELMDRDFEHDLGIVPFRHIQAKNLTKEQKVAISQWRETAEEAEYMFKATRALGARVITREVPKVAEWADFKATAEKLIPLMNEYDVDIAFHNHAQIGANTYDGVLLDYSDHFKINFDIGNYVAANDDDPLAFVEKYASRISSIHVKDRRRDNGPELPFGTGDTPLKDLFAALKAKRLDIPCDIEVEFPMPQGSNAVQETDKCREFCRRAILG